MRIVINYRDANLNKKMGANQKIITDILSLKHKLLKGHISPQPKTYVVIPKMIRINII